METAVIAKNARRIRHGLDLTQERIARKAGISIPTYSKIESGRTIPRMNTLYKVASAMGIGVQELLSPVRDLKVVRFRAQKKMKKRDQVLARTARWLDDFNYLLDAENSDVKYTLSGIPSESEGIVPESKPRDVARMARKKMGLDQEEPIHDITGLLASNGIKILTYPLASEGFFGMSIGESDGGPAIVVNVWDRIPVERWIFSTAHELGHLILHLDAYDINVAEEDKQEEKEANIFSSYFLMPQEGFEKEWEEACGLAFWDRVFKVKRIYHVSYKTVIYRLIDRGTLAKDIWPKVTSSLNRKCRVRISKNFEPEKLQEPDFKADWLDRLVRIALEKSIITKSRASEILDIPLQEMRSRVNSWVET